MHEGFMRRCFALARLGSGAVSPNPLVGAVIVRDGRVLAEGFHARHGAPHAEADAFANAREDVAGATLYVNLEPCCHSKKLTPPCVPAVIQRGIAHVVISNLDPNPQVAGRGVQELRNAGVQVTLGVLGAEGAALNEIFFHRMETGRPFVHLKAAATLDGKIALPTGESQWITGAAARQDAHGGRRHYDALVIGAETLRHDNPELTVRLPGLVVPRPPLRVVLTKSGQLPAGAKLFTDDLRHRTLVVTGPDTPIAVLPPQQVIRLPSLDPFPFELLYRRLADHGAHSLWLEGGAGLHSLFLAARQVQRVTLYLAPKLMGHGRALFHQTENTLASLPHLQSPEVQMIGEDMKVCARLS